MFLYLGIKSMFTTFILQLLICYAFGAYSEHFELKTENLNKRLVSYTISEKIARTHHDCVRECFHFGGQCKAINYNIKSRACELKSKGSVDVVDVSEYEHAAGYVFSDITDWPALTLSKCSGLNCNEKQNCYPHGNVAYECMDKVDCGQVPNIEFATVTAWVTTDGAVATYSCDFGYEFKGLVSEVTCKGGSWTAEEKIACTPKDCGPLADISYGTKTVTATTHGGIATYTCNYGYQYYSGDLMRTCVDGTWEGLELSCIIKDCGPLADISYGTKTVTATTHGGIATYTCNYGYQYYSGDLTRACVDGTWEGLEPSCIIKDCGPLTDILYGTKTVTATTHGGVATYTCNYGYQYYSGDLTRKCVDGTWGGLEPSCIIKDCGPLTDILYGTKTVTATTHGGITTYTCNFGYQYYSGDLTRTCVDGTWDGLEPSCIIKDCGQPAVTSHGSVVASVTTHGALATYTCETAYEITTGNAVLTCTDGYWLGGLPVCSPIPNVGCYYAGMADVFEGSRYYTTINGRHCQRWDSQSPHSHDRNNPATFPYGDVSANANYCRDPDDYGEPWCYTTDASVRWETCGVPLC